MRLLHAETLEFEEFFDTQIPPYLILSHRWGEKEISYKQINKKRAEEGPGLSKILGFCTLAVEKNHTWVWIDTCCIDKKSSAELSEAINSMFSWYQSAEECIVYLSDVSLGGQGGSIQEFETRFSASSWFTRGWTLQELLAPELLTFYDTDWKKIGDKDMLCGLISATTGIKESFISSRMKLPIESASVAVRMSWVARRTTSRSEDMAYCLLGLFDVNMPLLYGEGVKKAFLRLQTEIIKESDDETIFAWTANVPMSGMLANDPCFFSDSGAIYKTRAYGYGELRYWMTNKGLALRIPDCQLGEQVKSEVGTTFLIPLFICSDSHYDLGIQVELMSTRNVWCRTDCHSLTILPEGMGQRLPRKENNFTVIYIPPSLSKGHLWSDSLS
ncbi:MAG: hypothetical protein Q9221_006381 [Calogaya cf. arnoldii]